VSDAPRGRWLVLRALGAFVALPGMVAIVVPAFLLRPSGTPVRFGAPGGLVLGAGSVLLLWCVRDFLVRGRGTLAPWDPPVALVREGPYRFSRNPMYVAVLTMVVGWAIGFRSSTLAIYGVVLAVAFHLRVVWGEEPYLAATHGEAWTQYRSRVPRWLW